MDSIIIIQKNWRLYKIRSKYLNIINLPLDIRFIIKHYIHYDDILIKYINNKINKCLDTCTFYNLRSFIFLSNKYYSVLNNFNLNYYKQLSSIYSNTKFFIESL